MTNSLDSKRDFFISCNKADRTWATWIAWVLEDAGHSVLFQDWDFKGNFVLEMDRAHKETRRTIAILSPDYVASKFTAPEWAARFAQDATSEHDLLIPVRVRAFDPQGLLAQIVYIDLVDTTQEQARERLLNRVAGIRSKPKEEPFFPGSPLPVTQRSIPSEPSFPAPKWVWYSRPGTTEAGIFSVLAAVEVVIAVAAYWGYAIWAHTQVHLFLSVFIAPLLLLRSPQSIALGAHWFRNFDYNLATDSDSSQLGFVN